MDTVLKKVYLKQPSQICPVRYSDGWTAGRPVAKRDIKANSAQLELEPGLSLAILCKRNKDLHKLNIDLSSLCGVFLGS